MSQGPSPSAEPEIMWRAPFASAEPPFAVHHVRDGEGHIADRLGPCDDCGGTGSIWRWQHNGNFDCWHEIDGIPPWVGWA